MRVLRKISEVLSGFCFMGAIVSLVALVTALLYEVVARYGLNAPTLWAYDVAGYLTGSVFLLGCAWCQRQDGNIRIDALVARMSPRRRALFEAVFFAVLVLPALAFIGLAAVSRGYSSLMTGEVDPISAWAPRVWPFYLAVALGLSALWLQCLITTIDAFTRSREAPAVVAPDPDDGGRSWKLSG